MAVFIVLWPYLLISKLAEKTTFGTLTSKNINIRCIIWLKKILIEKQNSIEIKRICIFQLLKTFRNFYVFDSIVTFEIMGGKENNIFLF